MSNIKDEMAKIAYYQADKNMQKMHPIHGVVFDWENESEECKDNWRLVAQAILDMPEIKALVDAAQGIDRWLPGCTPPEAFDALSEALSPFTTKENE